MRKHHELTTTVTEQVLRLETDVRINMGISISMGDGEADMEDDRICGLVLTRWNGGWVVTIEKGDSLSWCFRRLACIGAEAFWSRI